MISIYSIFRSVSRTVWASFSDKFRLGVFQEDSHFVPTCLANAVTFVKLQSPQSTKVPGHATAGGLRSHYMVQDNEAHYMSHPGMLEGSETSATEVMHQMVAISQLSGNICLFDTDFSKNREKNKKYIKVARTYRYLEVDRSPRPCWCG